jgi:uncharacterized protein YjbI with pentapeptide repeats
MNIIDEYKAGRRDFCGRDLVNADLTGATLRGANLHGADLRGANLHGANLHGANLMRADLSGATLTGANLRRAALRDAKLSGAKLPSPTVVLLANWGRVSDELCLALMRYDASCHPDPSAFDRWAAEPTLNSCPYTNCRFQRAANFMERAELWSPGPAMRTIDLCNWVLKERTK